MTKAKFLISMLCCVGLVAAASIGLTACKKDAKETKKAQTGNVITFDNEEEASAFEERMQKDDNVVEDPFADEDETTKKGDSKATTKKGDAAATTKKAGADATTKKGESKTTAKKKSATTTKKSSKTTQAPLTDENGNQWSGWY